MWVILELALLVWLSLQIAADPNDILTATLWETLNQNYQAKPFLNISPTETDRIINIYCFNAYILDN